MLLPPAGDAAEQRRNHLRQAGLPFEVRNANTRPRCWAKITRLYTTTGGNSMMFPERKVHTARYGGRWSNSGAKRVRAAL